MDNKYYDKSKYNKKEGDPVFANYPRITTSVLIRHVRKGIPHMDLEEINAIEDLLDKNKIMFEYGAGGSTLHFCKFVKELISVENSKLWHMLIRKQIYRNHDNNVNLNFIDVTDKEDGSKYINFMDTLPHKYYDIISIDGVHRWRPQCLIKSTEYMKDDTIILFHDYFKSHMIGSYNITLDKYKFDYSNLKRLVPDSHCAIIRKEDIVE